MLPPSIALPLQQQLTQPVLTLARSEAGDHMLVVRVAPEALGPVTVQASVTDGSIRIALSAPSDAGRDALHQIIDGLRREASTAAPNTSVTVADQSLSDADRWGGDQRRDDTDRATRRARPESVATPPTAAPAAVPRASRSAHALDIVV